MLLRTVVATARCARGRSRPLVHVVRFHADAKAPPPRIIPSWVLESAFSHAMSADGTASAAATGPTIIDGKATADTIREELKARVASLVATHGRVSATPPLH